MPALNSAHPPRSFASLRMSKSGLFRGGYWIILALPVAALALALSACTSEATPLPPAPAHITITFPEARELVSITIVDSWSGYSRPSEMSARYELKRKANGYTGEPEFRAEDFNLSATRTVTGVLIPNSETEAFLSTLANLQAEVGTYDCQALRTGIGFFSIIPTWN